MNLKLLSKIAFNLLFFLFWLGLIYTGSYLLLYTPTITIKGTLINSTGLGLIILFFALIIHQTLGDTTNEPHRGNVKRKKKKNK